MKKPNVKRLLLLISSLCLLNSCATKPPDVYAFQKLNQHLSIDEKTQHEILTPSPVCMKEIGEMECGHGVSIMSGNEIYVGEGKDHLFNGKPWSQLQEECILLPAKESYAPLSAFIINTCKKNNCSDDVTRFKVKLDSLIPEQGIDLSP